MGEIVAAMATCHAPLISLQAVRSDAMPPGNVTDMTAAERQVLAAWIAAGAPAK